MINSIEFVRSNLTPDMAAYAKELLLDGKKQHEIAAILGVNQGRISEIKTGKLFSEILPRNV